MERNSFRSALWGDSSELNVSYEIDVAYEIVTF